MSAHVPLRPYAAAFMTTAFPQREREAGSSFPVPVLWFATGEKAYWSFRATNYDTGNLSLEVMWYADTATSGDVVWGARIACVTPNTDGGDIETKSFDTQDTQSDTHLGTTGQRLHSCVIDIDETDGIAAGDLVVVEVERLASGNTMTGDAGFVLGDLSYATT